MDLSEEFTQALEGTIEVLKAQIFLQPILCKKSFTD